MLTGGFRGNATGTLEEASGIYTGEEMFGTTLTSISISRALIEEKQINDHILHLIFNGTIMS